MLYACDCDLRAIFIFGEDGPHLSGGDLPEALQWCSERKPEDVFLFEIASPVDYTANDGNPGKNFNKRKWMIYNACAAGSLERAFPGKFLVAPSSAWTLGYNADFRQKLAKATARNYDLREAQSMLYFYRQRPTAWQPLGVYLSKI